MINWNTKYLYSSLFYGAFTYVDDLTECLWHFINSKPLHPSSCLIDVPQGHILHAWSKAQSVQKLISEAENESKDRDRERERDLCQGLVCKRGTHYETRIPIATC